MNEWSPSSARRCVTRWAAARQAPPSTGSPGKNTGAGCQSLLQGTFRTRGLNLRLLRCRQTPGGPLMAPTAARRSSRDAECLSLSAEVALRLLPPPLLPVF